MSVRSDVHTATITFARGEYDDDFHRLDQVIGRRLRAHEG